MEKWRARYDAFDTPRNWRIVEALVKVAAETGATVPQVALAWLLHKPGVCSVIFGARDVAQLDDNLPAADLALSPEQMQALDDASKPDLGYPYDFVGRIQSPW
jgi:aryl-alcohol dehydrogenase-like predicted oxidoreductase